MPQLLLVEPPTVLNPTAQPHRRTLFITVPPCALYFAPASLSTMREHTATTEPLVSPLQFNYLSYCIQLFRERLSQKLCTRQSRKVIWDMINILVLDTVAVEPTFVAFL